MKFNGLRIEFVDFFNDCTFIPVHKFSIFVTLVCLWQETFITVREKYSTYNFNRKYVNESNIFVLKRFSTQLKSKSAFI